MKTIFNIIVLLLLYSTKYAGQDMQFTQFYASAINLNPAFVGANVCSRVSLTYRNQWPGISNVYSTKMVSFDHGFYRTNLGIGATVAVDEAGNGKLKTTLIAPAVSYEAKIKRYSSIRFGLQPGIGIKSINYSGLLFGDQIYRGNNVSTVETAPQNKTYFDLGAGILYTNKNYWTGVSAYHLNAPNESFYNSPYDILPVKYVLLFGAKFQLNKEERIEERKKYISPILHYRGQKKFDQFDVGFYFTKHVFTLGFWYRGLPGLKAYKPGYQNNDAIAVIVGLQTKRIKIGYSFDKTISNLAGISKGAHEVTLSFQMCTTNKTKRRLVLISCPKF